MKIKILFFLFLAVLLACSEPLVETVAVVEEEGSYTEYEGVVSMTHDEVGIALADSDQPERDEFIRIGWSMGEHIYFVSKKFEFEKSESEIWGEQGCEQYLVSGKEIIEDEETRESWLYFEPSDNFWLCMELENCDPGDEVFHFLLFAREKAGS